MVEAASELLENDSKQQIATKIPLRGKVDNPSADVGTTVLFVLRNAFIEALRRGLDTGLGRQG
jgi:hypothetical protein